MCLINKRQVFVLEAGDLVVDCRLDWEDDVLFDNH